MMYGPSDDAPARIHSVNSIGGHWQRIGDEGRPALLLPQHVRLADIDGDGTVGTDALIMPESAGGLDLHAAGLDAKGIDFNEMRGGATWGDIDNDGLVDIVLTSGSQCRYADIYTRNAAGSYDLRTSECGLLHIPAGPGAILVDYNNDGLLDMATLVNGEFHLYRNTATPTSNFVSIDVGEGGMAGTSVRLFAAGRTYVSELASGRGLLMQDPLRFHIGLGETAAVDSLVVRWPNGHQQIYHDIAINRTVRIHPDEERSAPQSGALTSVQAYPNPFSEKVEFVYELVMPALVSMEIFDGQGRLVRKLGGGQQGAGVHSLTWDALDGSGQRVSQGAYAYRINAGREQHTGSVVVVK
jgi:hypothetical protein